MPVIMQKVLADQFLRKDPAAASGTVDLDGTPLQVFAGEVVTAGAKDNKDEVVNGKAVTWAFVEATGGRDAEKRKGFISNRFLGAEDERVEIVRRLPAVSCRS